MAEEKTTERKDRLKEITDGIEAGIKGIFESDRFKEYLSTMARFHNYSVNNVMLIHMQKPDATLVAGFNKWKDAFGRRVNKGEKGIKIIAPTPFKKKVEEQKLDPQTHVPMVDEMGQPIMEETEICIPLYKVVTVFDVSQTSGKPLPHLASDLAGDVKDFDIFMEALKRSCPVPLTVEPMAANMDGFLSLKEQRVAIRAGMSQVQTVCAGVHETTHARLHNYTQAQEKATAGKEDDPPAKKDAQTMEIEAEGVAYAVCKYFGIETGENSFGYLASWSKGKDTKVLRASLNTINKCANALINDLIYHIRAIEKERGISQEQAQVEVSPHNAAQPQEVQEALFLVDGMAYLHVQAADGNEGWDYTIYDAKTGTDMDGGVLEMPEVDLQTAAVTICMNHALNENALQSADLELAHDLQIGAFHPPEAASDTYPMPDVTMTMAALKAAGYDGDDLLPLSREVAQAYLDNGFPIYVAHAGRTDMFFEDDNMDDVPPEAVFTMLRSDWEGSPAFAATAQGRAQNQVKLGAAQKLSVRDRLQKAPPQPSQKSPGKKKEHGKEI